MTTIRVIPGEDLQLAINRAQFGDTITLLAGGIYKAPVSAFNWPNKSGGTGTDADYVTITTEGWNKTGRVADGSGMAKIVAVGGRGAIQIAANSKYLKLVGLEITNQSSGTAAEHVQDLLGSVDGGYYRNSKPAHFIVDQCYIHPQEDGLPTSDPNYNFRTVSHGIAWNVADLTVKNSRLSGFFGAYRHAQNVNIDSEAIAYSSGPGPLIVHNNYIDAWYTGILTGGADTDSDNFGTITSAQSNSVFSIAVSGGSAPVVGDMIAVANPGKEYSAARVRSVNGSEITCVAALVWNGLVNEGGRDAMSPAPIPVAGQNVKWRGFEMDGLRITGNTFNTDYAFASYWRRVNGSNSKGWIEFKNGINILFEGNICQGYPNMIGMGVQNQQGSAPWSGIRNVIFRNNLFSRFSYVTGGSITGYSRLTKRGGNILIKNNLAFGPGGTTDVNGNHSAFIVFSEMDGPLTVENNTVVDSANEGFAVQINGGAPEIVKGTGTYRNNIFYGKKYGHTVVGTGDAHAHTAYTTLISDKNIIINEMGHNPADIQSYWWANSLVLASTAAVKFTNSAAGTTEGFRLLSTSPGLKAGTDGKDVGVDIDALNAALGGAVLPPSPPPPPPPTPDPPPPSPPTPPPAPIPPPPAPTPTITGFILVNAATNKDIGPLTDGMVIDLRLLGKQLNVRAESTGGPVTFELDDAFVRIENAVPFALGGDTEGRYHAWTPALGTHLLRAFTNESVKSVRFSVIESVEPIPTPPPPDPIPVPPPPTPVPPVPCSISAPASISVARNSTGTIAVTLQNLTGPAEVKVIGSDGQVTVSPLSRAVTGTSAVMQFSLKVKRQSRTITFTSPCGSAQVKVNVT